MICSSFSIQAVRSPQFHIEKGLRGQTTGQTEPGNGDLLSADPEFLISVTKPVLRLAHSGRARSDFWILLNVSELDTEAEVRGVDSTETIRPWS